MKTDMQNGFTLIEVMIAMAILSIGILGVASMQTSSTSNNASARGYTEAAAIGQQQMERLLSLNYNHGDLDDTDGDGTGQDLAAPFGVDDNGGNFGLDDNTTGAGNDTDADHSIAVGLYNVFWNIAVDHPIAGTKKIRLFVQWQTSGFGPRELVFDGIKPSI